VEGFYRHRGIGWQEISFIGLSWVKQAYYDCRQMAEQTIVGFIEMSRATGLPNWSAAMDSTCGIVRHGRCGRGW
jgi:hypothetical protein